MARPRDAPDPPARALLDAGLQPERTRLAWRRTLLALLVAAVVGERLLAPVLGRAALVLAGAGLLAVLALSVAVVHRTRAADASLHGRGHLADAHGGTVLAATALLCSAGGVLALVVVVQRALAPG